MKLKEGTGRGKNRPAKGLALDELAVEGRRGERLYDVSLLLVPRLGRGGKPETRGSSTSANSRCMLGNLTPPAARGALCPVAPRLGASSDRSDASERACCSSSGMESGNSPGGAVGHQKLARFSRLRGQVRSITMQDTLLLTCARPLYRKWTVRARQAVRPSRSQN